MKSWLLASRPKTLPAAIAPVCAGCAVAWSVSHVFSLSLALCTMFSAIAIQIATNFFNDAIDADKGADTAARLGPTRTTSAGLTSRKAMYLAAGITLAIAVAFGLPLILARGWMILLIGIPSVYFSFGYTGGPLPLAYRGLGDFFVLLFFGLIAVSGSVFVQLGTWPWQGFVSGCQIGLLSTALIAINNLRDVSEDTLSNKKTLAVRFGQTFSRVEITVLCLLPHLIGIAAWQDRRALWPLPTALLGLLISARIWKTSPSRAYNEFLALSALQLILFTVLFVMACVK